MQSVRSYLHTHPFPGLGLRVDIRAPRQCVLRLVGEAGKVEDLAQGVEVHGRVAEVRKGRRNRPNAQRSGGFSKQRGTIRFRSAGATHVGDLS